MTNTIFRPISNNIRRSIASIPTYWWSIEDVIKCVQCVMGVEDYFVANLPPTHPAYNPLRGEPDLRFMLDIVGTEHTVSVSVHKCDNIPYYEVTCYVSL